MTTKTAPQSTPSSITQSTPLHSTSVPLAFSGTSAQVEGCVGMYYPEEIRSLSIHKIPNAESFVEHKQSTKERKVKEWLGSKSRRKSSHIPNSTESQKKFSFTNLKVKATKSFDNLVEAANSVIQKMKSRTNKKSEIPDSLEQKVLSKPFPKASVKLTIEEEQERAFRKEEIERLTQEEQEARKDYEKVHIRVIELEKDQVSKINKEENKRRRIIEHHEHITYQMKSEIEELDKRMTTLETKIKNAEKVGNTNLADKYKKEMIELKQRFDENKNGLNNAIDTQNKALRDYDHLVDKRKKKDNKEIQRYFDAENVTQAILEQKIILRKALQEYEKNIQKRQLESASTPSRSPGAQSNYHNWHKQQIDLKIMSETERKESMKSAVIEMQSNNGIKQTNSELELSNTEGYTIGEKVCVMEHAEVRKAGSNLQTKKDHEYFVKIISYKDIDPQFESQLRKHGFYILRYFKEHPFKRVIRIHELFQVKNDKALIFEQTFQLTLEEFLKKHGAMNEKEAKHVLNSITEAVNYLHCIGIAHQNISPQSVYINSKQHVKLGLLEWTKICWNPKAQRVIFQNGNRKLSGSAFAPEISKQQTYNPMSVDVYSIGAVACYMLLKKYPFNAKIAFSYEYQIEEITKELRSVVSNLGLDFILQCLTKNPELRPAINKITTHAWFTSILD